jgi:hypothetical protein
MVYMMTIWIVHTFASMWFPTTTIPTAEICGTHNELCAFGTKIPFSHIGANSLCCCKMSHFIYVVAICKKDYSQY